MLKFEFERWRISNNFTAFDIRRMLKKSSRGLFTFCKCKQTRQLTLTQCERLVTVSQVQFTRDALIIGR